jgi:outer membrane protein W
LIDGAARRAALTPVLTGRELFMKRVFGRLACAVALVALFTATGLAQEGKKNKFNVAAAFFMPTIETRLELNDEAMRIEVDKTYALSIGYHRMIGKTLGLDLDVFYFTTRERAKRLGLTAESADYTATPIVAGLTWHTGGDFDIYGGPAVAYMLYSDRDSNVAPAAQFGLDAALGRRGWGIRVNVMYIHTNIADDQLDPLIGEGLQTSVEGQSLDINVNPFVFSAGMSFRF